MKDINNIDEKKVFHITAHLVLIGFVGVVLFILIQIFVNFLHIHEDEAVSFALTVSFLVAIYFGRFIAIFWIPKSKKVFNQLSVILPIFMVAVLFVCVLFITSSVTEQKAIIVLFLFLSLFVFNVLLGLFIKIIRLNIKNRIQTAETIAANSKTELQLLQSQLSPHFLFNTLNNMYGISMSEHEKIPPLLLKLSDLLRYSVYDAKELFVPLKEEISYLNNYIDFEKIRIGERLQLTISMEDVSNLKLKIAPMLLIVFVENAFKHSKNTNNESIAINIGLKIWDDSVLFSVKNSQGIKEIAANTLNKNSGLGLANVKKRLELLYPNQYDLQIDDSEDSYRVMLRLNLK